MHYQQPDFFKNAQMNIQIILQLCKQQKNEIYLSQKINIGTQFNYAFMINCKQLGLSIKQSQTYIIQYQTRIKRKSTKLQTCVIYYIKPKEVTQKILSNLKKQRYENISQEHEFYKLYKNGNRFGLTFLAQEGSKIFVHQINKPN